MQIQFDPNQQYQRDAVSAVLDLFEGQQKAEANFSVVRELPLGRLSGLVQTEHALGNQLGLSEEKVRLNCRAVQDRNDIDSPGANTALEGWELPAMGAAGDATYLPQRDCLHFSVEMETGTGKTYVYLRTIYELAERYGWLKFIIVVPSVAIREGVKENLRITAEHFRNLYHQKARVQIYEGRRVQELKEFAQANTLQILVINIDAFNKNFGPESERRNNVIFKQQEGFGNSTPMETVQAAQPIVILDEPQSIDNTERAQEAIRALRPLFTLRYSATHKNPYNLVYRLGPVEAFAQRLVKRIVVDSTVVDGAGASAFIEVKAIEAKKGFKAKLLIHAQGKNGPKAKTVTVTDRDDLYAKSNRRDAYRDGYAVRGISVKPGDEYLEFANGLRLRIGEQHGGAREEVQAAQIRRTVQHHLDKELEMLPLGVKVLSLFFVDRVANYRVHEDDGNKPGKFALVVEAALRECAKKKKYAALEWLQLAPELLHDGYFAADKKTGTLKDARGDTADDATAYELIMGNKERLLSLETPLRFIFSHSALREGWDNPNVFQICTLNDRQSTMTKRQEIGRGLRLPVNQQGVRVRDENLNRLFVVANESYDEFARQLQEDYARDGVHFGRVSHKAFAPIIANEELGTQLGAEASQEIWLALEKAGVLSSEGDILIGAELYDASYKLKIPRAFLPFRGDVLDVLRAHRIERHVQNSKLRIKNLRREEQIKSPEFQELWRRICSKTRYRVQFETEDLIRNAVAEIGRLPKIEAVKISFTTAVAKVGRAGVSTTKEASWSESVKFSGPLPDILAYLQAQTDLTRSTLQQVLTRCNRLDEFLVNPQEFMDQVVAALQSAKQQLIVDGIQYERLPEEWQQERIFDREFEIDELTAMKVENSIYEYVPWDSQVERDYAAEMRDSRTTFPLFVKLPRSFRVVTPVGEYNPDWAIVKEQNEKLYLVRETKGSRDYRKLRSSEAYKARCGEKHFEALGVPFKVVKTVADD